jgi:hypothetical protein
LNYDQAEGVVYEYGSDLPLRWKWKDYKRVTERREALKFIKYENLSNRSIRCLSPCAPKYYSTFDDISTGKFTPNLRTPGSRNLSVGRFAPCLTIYLPKEEEHLKRVYLRGSKSGTGYYYLLPKKNYAYYRFIKQIPSFM